MKNSNLYSYKNGDEFLATVKMFSNKQSIFIVKGFPGGSVLKKSTFQCRRHRRLGFNSWVWKIPERRKWKPTPIFLPEKSHGKPGERSLAG